MSISVYFHETTKILCNIFEWLSVREAINLVPDLDLSQTSKLLVVFYLGYLHLYVINKYSGKFYNSFYFLVFSGI